MALCKFTWFCHCVLSIHFYEKNYFIDLKGLWETVTIKKVLCVESWYCVQAFKQNQSVVISEEKYFPTEWTHLRKSNQGTILLAINSLLFLLSLSYLNLIGG